MGKLRKHPLVSVFLRETERIKHNTAYRFLLFIGPMVGILLLYFIFKQGVAQDFPIAIVDQDNSSLSIKISNAVNSAPDVFVAYKPSDIYQAEELLKQGKINAIVVLPEHMQKNVTKGIQSSIPLYINGTNVLISGIIQRSVLTSMETISGGIQMKKLMLKGKNTDEAMARIRPVKIQKHILYNPYSNYNYYLNSAMLYVMLYLFAFLASIYSFGNELKLGTGNDLLKTSGNSVRLAILGKLLPYNIIFCGFAMVIDYILYVVGGFPLEGNYLIIFFGQFLTIATYQAIGIMFVTITKNLRLSMSLGAAYLLMGITFSGLTFPIEGIPKSLHAIMALFPFTWWEKIIISQSLRGAPIKEALVYLCYIFAFLLFSIMFFPKYKRCLSDEKLWGKQ